MYSPDSPEPSLLRAVIAQAFLALPAAFVVQLALHLPTWGILLLGIAMVALFAAASYSRQNNDWLGVECFSTERYARYANPKLLNPPRR
ncbi:MAG: hypothetical protein M3160_04490 [Candidatus Eremiobacteraeota bacterium]|nr:hypothetical protein [Candidatus Eremiobacteraeota bacterium]